MKIRLWNRIILFVGAVLVLLIGAVTIVGGLQIGNIQLQPADSTGFFSITRLLVLFGGVVLILYSLYILMLPRRIKKQEGQFILQQTAGGELRISMKAIENIVKKCVDLQADMRMIMLNVDHSRDKVRIDLRVSLLGNISIPMAAEALQTQIKRQLAASAGIDESEVRISVETAETTAKQSPYLVNGNKSGKASVPLHETASELSEISEPEPTPPEAAWDMTDEEVTEPEEEIKEDQHG